MVYLKASLFLKAVSSHRYLTLNNNPNLHDLSPLAGLSNHITIYLDDASQYTTLLPESSTLCKVWKSGAGGTTIKAGGVWYYDALPKYETFCEKP